MARHITPGIPVSRRSNNASYYSAGEESEVIEVSVNGESFDGFAATLSNADEEDSQDQHSSVGENATESAAATAVKNEMLEKSVQQLKEGHEPAEVIAVASAPIQREDELQNSDLVMQTEVETPLMTIYPPKKRQRMLEAAMMREETPEKEVRDVKVSSANISYFS